MSAAAVGLDFGTTNTVLARVDGEGRAHASQFRHENELLTSFRTVLALWQERGEDGLQSQVEAGPWAIDRFIADPFDTRFLQSFKTFAASRAFQHTTLAGRNYRFEDLLAAFFDKYLSHADTERAALPRRIVVGRPVTFAGANPDAKLAAERYEKAFTGLGFTDIHHVYEPVAAAFFFAQRLTRDATVLVADFGGGTSDFSLIHFTRSASRLTATPLAQTGVGVAGDTFDYRIIDAIVTPRLGKGTQYRSWGKVLDVPGHYYANFARWNQLSILKSPRLLAEIRELARHSLAPEKLETLIDFIDADVGYPLYRAVSDTKMQLSSAETARLHFKACGVTIDRDIKRAEFEGWIAPDLERIDRAVAAALTRAGVEERHVDKVFLTGGSSFVPAVRHQFEQRFGTAKVETGDQLLSIAYGLALIGAEEDLTPWTVSPGTEVSPVDAED
jgi:hypothetical chaperone protein